MQIAPCPPPQKKNYLGTLPSQYGKNWLAGKKKNQQNYTQSCDLQINLRSRKKKYDEKWETDKSVVGIPRHSHCAAAQCFLSESTRHVKCIYISHKMKNCFVWFSVEWKWNPKSGESNLDYSYWEKRRWDKHWPKKPSNQLEEKGKESKHIKSKSVV